MRDSTRRPDETAPAGARPDGDEEVRQLLRAAGRRPAPPADDLAEITAAARTAWREKVGTDGGATVRRVRLAPAVVRWLALAASLLLAVLVGWWWVGSEGRPTARTDVATVELVHGVASGDGRALAPGSRVGAGTVLTTAAQTGEPARLALRLAGGASLRLATDTTLRLVAAGSAELVGGTVYVDSPPGAAAGGGLDIMTPLGTVVEVGTQFEVRYDERAGELGVRVREGAVSVRRNGQAATARRGESLAVRRDGSVSRAPSPVGGGSWEWILEAAPAIDVEGRTLDAFLAWAARETGLDVVFEDDELAAHAATIELSASLEGLRPDQAIDVVVRASGLEVARDGDRLLVARPH